MDGRAKPDHDKWFGWRFCKAQKGSSARVGRGKVMLREIVFDTETTGLDALRGDGLIEIGCVEIVNRIPTGREFHRYINPERDVDAGAVAVHGLTRDFLRDKPVFAEVVEEFLDFIGNAPLVAH